MRIRGIVVALTCIPALLFAQRGGGGGGGGGGVRRPQAGFSGADDDSKKEVKALTSDDVRDGNPIHLLIDKRKDLKLTDEQLSALKDSESKLKDSTSSLFKAVDSLNMVLRIAARSDDDDGSRAIMRQSRLKIAIAVSNIRTAYDAYARDGVALLTPDQQKTANDLLQQQRDELDKKTRDRLGAGRGS